MSIRTVLLVVLLAVVATGVIYLTRPADKADLDVAAASDDLPEGALDQVAALTTAVTGELIDDPGSEGWDTEVFNTVAGGRLKALGKLIEHPEHLDAAHLSELVTADVTCSDLLPDALAQVYTDGATSVQRPAGTLEQDAVHTGIDGALAALRALCEPFAQATDVHVKFKLYTVEPRGEVVTTRQYVAVMGHTEAGSIEQNATWRIDWQPGTGDQPPRIQRLVVEDFELVRVDGAPSRTLFSDCTAASLGANASFHDQLMFGMTHWLPRLEKVLMPDQMGHHGLAVGDVNGDGLEDVYLCQTGGLPNRLFVQNADGTATDRSAEAGVDVLDLTRAALLVDMDNDGDQDLVLGLEYGLVLYENDGQGRFTRRAVVPLDRDIYSLSAADYDGDGDLDVYVCIYDGGTSEDVGRFSAPLPYHDANNGGRNVLLRHEGDWTFTDVTAEAGLERNNTRWSFAASWEDFDNDGHVDLYVANDYGRNNLYRNHGDGTFADVAAEMGVEDISAGMSVTWADYNRDGLMDLYVSNMFSSAGNRIAYQRQFKAGVDDATLSQYQRHARGNTLFANRGDGFEDVSVQAGVTMGRWAWSSNFLDINNDGWDDLFVANGFITNPLVDDL